MRQYVANLIGEENAEEFAKWAFGDGYINFEATYEFQEAWNKLHSDLLILSGGGRPSDDIIDMIHLWQKIEIKDLIRYNGDIAKRP